MPIVADLVGTEIAKDVVLVSTPVTLADLLATIKPTGGTKEGMLRSTTARFLEFVGLTPERVQVDELHHKKEAFIAHLNASKYKSSSVKSYRNYLNMLLRRAEEHGWTRPELVITPEWQKLAEVMPRTSALAIVKYAVRIGATPATFSEDDLAAWRKERGQAGRSLIDAERDCSRFRQAIEKAGLLSLVPLVKSRDRRYGVPLSKMQSQLRSDIETILAWKLDEFVLDRPAEARIRPISAKRLSDLFSQITGFVQNIAGKPEITSLAELITRENIGAYTTWARNVRKVKGQSLSTGLGMVYAALRYHPSYTSLDLSWFERIIDQLPIDSQSVVDERKARKYISYDEADLIPGRIRAKHAKRKNPSPRASAIAARNELIMLWPLLLPWRQKNIRECRVTGSTANLFYAQIAPYCSATRPAWIIEREREKPGGKYWQIRFSEDETKMHHDVQMFLPAELVPLLNEYLAIHRPVLLGNAPDPETLFLNTTGGAMSNNQIRGLFKRLTFEHAGTAVTPHIYRDIVAIGWLMVHPEDYLTVSKMLFHRNINTTIRVYGRRFDESTGAARMDNWRASRKPT